MQIGIDVLFFKSEPVTLYSTAQQSSAISMKKIIKELIMKYALTYITRIVILVIQ